MRLSLLHEQCRPTARRFFLPCEDCEASAQLRQYSPCLSRCDGRCAHSRGPVVERGCVPRRAGSAAARPNVESCRIISNAPPVAKLLRLVSATQPRSGGVPRLAAFACLRLNVWREPATQTEPTRAAAQSRRARFGRRQAALVFAAETKGRQARFSRLE